MESILNIYCDFLADQFHESIPHVQNGNQGVDALLHGENPLWEHLISEAPVLAAKQVLGESPEFYSLYREYSVNRPQINFEDYLDSSLLDFALKLLRRSPAMDAKSHVASLVMDFMKFISAKRIEATQFAPLFNLKMDSRKVELGENIRICYLDAETKIRVGQYFSERSIVFSRTMLDNLELGIFHDFSIPIRSTTIEPPPENIGRDAELILRILKPGRVINCGLSMYWTTGWHLNEHGGSGLPSQFPWIGPSFELSAGETSILPKLWNEIRNNITVANLRQKKYFQTAQRRFVKATENQAMDDRLLDLFISLEALLLRSTEKHQFTEKVTKRFSILMQPLDTEERSRLAIKCEQAYKQRHTIAHGIDRELMGFDGTIGTYNGLVQEVDCWLGHIIRKMILLIGQLGSRETVIAYLDNATSDFGAGQQIAQILSAD